MCKPTWLLYHCRALSQHNLILCHLLQIRKTNKCTQYTSLRESRHKICLFLDLNSKVKCTLRKQSEVLDDDDHVYQREAQEEAGVATNLCDHADEKQISDLTLYNGHNSLPDIY